MIVRIVLLVNVYANPSRHAGGTFFAIQCEVGSRICIHIYKEYYTYNQSNMTLSLAIVIGINTVNIILLMIVVRYRNRELHPFLVWVFAGSIVFLMLWSLTNYLADISHNSVEALFWTRATFPAAFCMGLFVYLFSHIFPVRRGGVLFPVVYAVMTFLFSIVAFQPALIQSVTLDPVMRDL